MARPPTLSVADVERALRAYRFEPKRTTGAHTHWEGYIRGQRRIVTVDANDAPFHSRNRTLHSMVRQSGLTKGEFYSAAAGETPEHPPR